VGGAKDIFVGWLEQWNTRSRKRRTPQQQRSCSLEEGYSVETTDTDDDSISHPSAVASPAPSQRLELWYSGLGYSGWRWFDLIVAIFSCSEDSDSVLAHRQWKKAIIIVWRHAAQHK